MRISDYLTKSNWKRRTPKGTWKEFTQEDFLNDYYPTSHQINDPTYKAMRPIYDFKDPVYDANGELIREGEIYIKGFDEVERVPVGLEQIVCRTLPVNMFGNDFRFEYDEAQGGSEAFKLHTSYWEQAGIRDAIIAWYGDAGAVGDAALYLNPTPEGISYQIFSKLKGDDIYMVNKTTFARKYTLNNATIVEIYTEDTISTYVLKTSITNSNEGSLALALNIDKSKFQGEETEDGYVEVDKVIRGYKFFPISYLRLDDVLYGQGVGIRERIEKLLSYWGDSNNAFSMPMMVVNSATVELPALQNAHKVIGLTDPNGKADILTPPDVSTSFTKDLKENRRNYYEVTGIVIVDQEDLKGGDYSGAFLYNLYFPVIVWSINALARIRPNLNNLIKSFDTAVGIASGKIIEMNNLNLTWTIDPFTPKNKMEDITMLTQSVAAGITTRKSAAREAYHNGAYEEDRLIEQDIYDDEREAKRAKSKTPTEIPKPELSIDNNLK